MKPIEVPIRDIPQDVLDRIQAELLNFFAPLALLDFKQRRLSPIGSGTFISMDGNPCVLTAAHVWREIAEAEHVCICLSTKAESFIIKASSIVPELIDGNDASEWGPDLALLRLLGPKVETVQSKRSFLNFETQLKFQENELGPSDKDLLVVCGVLGTKTRVERDEKATTTYLRSEAMFSLVENRYEHDGYDYLDIGADLKLNAVAKNFGGTSGGGLWKIRLSIKNGEFSWDNGRRLLGVAYRQTDRKDDRRAIRCHGPKSLYDIAAPQWMAKC